MREFPERVGERAVRRCAGGFFLTVYVGMSDSGGVAAGLRRGGGVFPEAVSRKVRWGDEMKKPPSSGGFEFWAKWLRARSRAAGWRF